MIKERFEWELLKMNNSPYAGTYRAKVPGGWIVLHWSQTRFGENGGTSESMVFIPDPNHEWKVN